MGCYGFGPVGLGIGLKGGGIVWVKDDTIWDTRWKSVGYGLDNIEVHQDAVKSIKGT